MSSVASPHQDPFWPVFAASAGQTPADPEWRPVNHRYHEVCVNAASTPVRFETKGPNGIRAFFMPPGSQWVFPAGEEIVLRDLSDCEHVVAWIDPAYLSRLVDDPTIHIREVMDSRPLEYLVRALAHEAAQGGPGGYAFAESLVLGIALQLTRHAGSAGRDKRQEISKGSSRGLPASVSRRVIDLIEARVEEAGGGSRLAVEDLAREAGMSPFRFFRAFKATMGAPPHQYVLRRRLERARRLLDHPDARISEVALATGFADQSHFTRAFRRHYGVTPGVVHASRTSGPADAR
jgi:AraC family transcriptional regulator